jgi:hypothetical protein
MSPTVTAPRALSVASVHLGPINDSRRRAGLAPLTAADLAQEFADLDRLPPRTKVNRRDAANLAAWRQGIPTTQAGVDAMHAEMAAKLNATLPAYRPVPAGRPTSVVPGSGSTRASRQTQVEIDVMHSQIVAKLNATLPERWRPKAGRCS